MLKHKIYLTIFISALLVMACENQAEQPEYDWEEEFKETGVNPYNLSLLKGLLRETDQGMVAITNDFYAQMASQEKLNYLFVGQHSALNDSEVTELTAFVSRGNNAFIFTRYFPYQLLQKIYPSSNVHGYGQELSKSINVQFEGEEKSQAFNYQYNFEDTDRYWSYARLDSFEANENANTPKSLSTIDKERSNFFEIDYGQGKFYFHCTPLLFTNFHLVNKAGFDHSQKVFEHLNEGTIIWDNSKDYVQDSEQESRTNPFKLLFSHYSLKWAWYTLLGSLFVYVLFRSKRQQRIIPVIAGNSNDSIEFTKSLGRLYFKKGNASMLAAEMYELFLADARSHYNLDTNIEPEEFQQKIEKRSGIKKEDIDNLMQLFEMREHDSGSSKDLIKLHQALNSYYKNRK